MGLIRTILALIIIVILLHVGLSYAGLGRDTSNITQVIYGLGVLLESPAAAVINALPLSPGQRSLTTGQNSFYVVALAAAAGYFVLYLLLGVGRRK
ncbi:MAG: hypothetical protein ACR2GU_08530 [Rubrobacteraceae bacterium]